MDKIRIGIVGLGPIAQNAHLPAIERARDLHLHAVAETDAALREQMAPRYARRSSTDIVTIFSTTKTLISSFWRSAMASTCLSRRTLLLLENMCWQKSR